MPQQYWNTDLYDRKHSFVYEYGKDLLPTLAPQPGERILDIGCGTGHLTSTIAAAGAHVLGIDSSAEMIARARAAYPSLEFLVADARTFVQRADFDAIFSNAALHWVPEADRVAACMAESLKPGGRLVVELAGKGNVAGITSAIRQVVWELLRIEVEHQWYFPALGEYTALLERHGLEPRSAMLYDRPTQLEGAQGLQNWIAMFAGALFQQVPDQAKQQVVEQVEQRLRPRLWRQGSWFADYRRLQVVAHKL